MKEKSRRNTGKKGVKKEATEIKGGETMPMKQSI